MPHSSLGRRAVLWPALLAVLPWLSVTSATQEPTTANSSQVPAVAKERELEKDFDSKLDPAELGRWLKQLSSSPNNVGSVKDKENAELILATFKQAGWDAHIETFSVLYPTPKALSLDLVAPHSFSARLLEPAIPVRGETSAKRVAGLPPYNVYGADGDVTGELVYVNYGMREDYKELARRGIDVHGKIVIARYGGGWRGLKPKLAHEHGAIGCIIYSDPKDDGYYNGDVYPKGGWRPAGGVQRGTVLEMQTYPGDPLTPGTASTQDAKRLTIADAKTLAKIPVLPISYSDAQPLMATLAGPVAPESWRGALPLTYHLGPGPAKVHLKVLSDWSQREIYDVIATIPGEVYPNQWVIRGNHHDGWSYGAWDPLSGTVDMMEEAKAIGLLRKSGWAPKRTLVYASWDGEEAGLLGSTEWVEAHAEELKRKAVVYVNSDTNTRGFLDAAGSPSLQHLVNMIAADIKDPETGVSLQQRLRAKLEVDGFEQSNNEETTELAKIARTGGDLPIEALGSGSDYSPFLEHLGIATLSLSFGGEDDQSGAYHSDYDSYDHFVRFGDPGFTYGIVEAKTVGHVVLRMSEAAVLPLRFSDFANAVEQYGQELHKLENDMRERAESLDTLLKEDAFRLATDPTRPIGAPERAPAAVFINFAPLDNALRRLTTCAAAFDTAAAAVSSGAMVLDAGQLGRLNELMQGMEQRLLDSRGLPGRPWYEHMIYAPGFYLGYDVKTLPGLREAIEEGRWDEANTYSAIIAGTLNQYCSRLDEAVIQMHQGRVPR